MHADGTGAVPLTGEEANDWSPVWSPDGSRIVFYSDRDGEGKDRIVVMSPDGGAGTKLTHEGNAFWPSWNHNGSRILFTLDDAIHAMNADGTGRARIVDGFFARWSPDGKRIAWIEGKLPDTRIQVADASGADAICLTCPR